MTFSSAKLDLGHSFGIEWKHICEQINFYNLCVFIRYSEANAIKWLKPILYAMRGGGTVPNSNVTSTGRALILYMGWGLESKCCVYEWICLIKPTQDWKWQNAIFCAVFFFLLSLQGCEQANTYTFTLYTKQTCTQTVTHVVLPSAAKGSNENKWQSSFPTGTREGT